MFVFTVFDQWMAVRRTERRTRLLGLIMSSALGRLYSSYRLLIGLILYHWFLKMVFFYDLIQWLKSQLNPNYSIYYLVLFSSLFDSSPDFNGFNSDPQ